MTEEVIGLREPMGDGIYNMWLTDERIIRCADCDYFDTRKCKSQWPFRLNGFCAWAKPREDA